MDAVLSGGAVLSGRSLSDCLQPSVGHVVTYKAWRTRDEKTKQTIPGAPLEFAKFSTVVQSMEITIPEVMEGGRKYNITMEMKIELDKKFWENADRPDDLIREIKAVLRKAIQDHQKNGGSILKKAKAAGSAKSDDGGSNMAPAPTASSSLYQSMGGPAICSTMLAIGSVVASL